MSTQSSVSDAASEIDPYFRTIGLANSDSSFKSSPADSLVELSRPVVTFPLPPRRRLRPGDLVNTHLENPSTTPTSCVHEPVALYGVAIGGENRQIPAGSPGRAQVKKDRYSSAYMHVKRPSSAIRSSSNTPSSADGQTVGIRARNPSHYLARNTHSSISGNVNLIKPVNAPPLSKSTDPCCVLSSDGLDLPRRPHRTDSVISFPSEVNLTLPPGFLENYAPSSPSPIGGSPPRNDTTPDSQHAARLKALNQALQIDDNPVEKTGMSHPRPPSQPVSHSNSISRKHDTSLTSVRRIRFAPPPRKSLIRVTTSTFPTLLWNANEASKKPSRASNKSRLKRLLFSQPKAQKPSRPAISLPLSDSFSVTASGTLPTTPKHQDPRSLSNHLELQSPSPALSSLPISMSRHSVDNLTGRGLTLPEANLVSQAPQSARSRPRSRSFAGLDTCQTSTHLPGTIPPSYYENVGYHHPTSSLSTPNPLKILSEPGPQSSLPHTHTPNPPSSQPHHGQPGSYTFTEHFTPTRPSAEPHVDSLPCTTPPKSVRFRRTLELIPDPSFLASLSISPEERGMPDGPQPLKSSADRPGTGYQRNNSGYASGASPAGTPQHGSYCPVPSGPPRYNSSCEISATQKNHNNQSTKAKVGMGMKLLMRTRRRNSDETSLSFSLKSETGSMKNSSQLEIPMVSEPDEPAVRKAHHDLTTKRSQDNSVADADLNLLKRTLAPKLNLTFVDLDHHIGSRFSVNTLFKEVQKAIPEIEPLEISKLPSQDSLCQQAQTTQTASHEHTRSQSTPCLNSQTLHASAISHHGRTHTRTQTVPNATSNAQAPQVTSSDFRLSRPRTRPKLQVQRASKVENENENRPICELVEVVKTEGRELTFEMVVPNSHLSSGSRSPAQRCNKEVMSESKVSQTTMQLSTNHGANNYACELKKMSDRLLALDNSLEASQTKNTPTNMERVPAQKKLERVETWLSSVPPSAVSVIISPGGQNIHHRPLDWPLGNGGDDSPISAISSDLLQPTSDYDETDRWQEDFPESPIDRYAVPVSLARSGSKKKATLVLRSSNVQKTTPDQSSNGQGQLTQTPAKKLNTFKLEMPPIKNKSNGPVSIDLKKGDENPIGLVRVRAPSDSSSGTSTAATRIPKVTQMVAIHERPKSGCRT
ncbi:hypothetical protein DFH28DRAFT_888723 [Melampsora americana]|nr:hypothetical protein DFH28DRAFT_888723 [Melampsora americana]